MNGSARVRADVALLLVAGVWGATFVLVKDALVYAGPFTFLAARFALAFVLLAPLLLRGSAGQRWDWRGASAGAVAGVCLFGGYAFQTVGLQYTTAARAAFITGLSVVMVPLASGLLFRRPISGLTWLGVALATIGLALLALGPDVLSGGPLVAGATGFGDALVLGCAVSFAAQILVVGEVAPRYEPNRLTLTQLGLVALLALLASATFEQPRLAQVPPILPAVLVTGVLATAGAFTVQTHAQRFTSATHTALIFATEPVFGALFAYLLAGEVLAPLSMLGCALILAGMAAAQFGARSNSDASIGPGAVSPL